MRVFCFEGSDSFHRTILKDSKCTLLLSSLAIGVLQAARFIPSWLLRSNFIDPSLWKFMWNSLAILGSCISFGPPNHFWQGTISFILWRGTITSYLICFLGLGIRLPLIMADTDSGTCILLHLEVIIARWRLIILTCAFVSQHHHTWPEWHE